MTTDPIVDELDRLRAEQMAQVNFDFDAFYRHLKEQQSLLPQVPQAPPKGPPKARWHRAPSQAARP